MFHCAKGHLTAPGEKMVRVVVETRDKVYPARYGIGENGERVGDNGGIGWEIAKEAQYCKACAEKKESGEQVLGALASLIDEVKKPH